MIRQNADPNKCVAIKNNLVAVYQIFGKNVSVSNAHDLFLNPIVPTSLHGAAFRDKYLQLFDLYC